MVIKIIIDKTGKKLLPFDKRREIMSFWKIMNWIAWGPSVFLFLLIAKDFIKTEKEQAKSKQ